MSRSPLLVGVGGTLGGMAVVLALLAVAFEPLLLAVSLPLGVAGYLIWYQGTGRLAARVRRERAEARAGERRANAARERRGDPRFTDPAFRERRRRAREFDPRRERADPGREGPRDPAGAGRTAAGYGPGGYASGAAAATGLSTDEAYRRLGVEPGSDPEAIRSAYREKVKEVHPDAEDGDEEAFKRVNEAYETLEERVG